MASHRFEDAEFVQSYAASGPMQFVPGFSAMHQLATQLLHERIGDDGTVLVLGAGGGHELEFLARRQPKWKFVAVDPSAEMLRAARDRLGAPDSGDRVTWVNGYIDDAPTTPLDGATCLLTLHFVKDDGAKLHTLQSVRKRLVAGSPFVLVDLCIDVHGAQGEQQIERYARFARESGADPAEVAETCDRLRTVLNMVTPARNEALLTEAGFQGLELFYAGLSWRG